MFCTIDKHLLKSHWKKGGSLSEKKKKLKKKSQESQQILSPKTNH